jgi:uncharacterized SAM-binding protein YcdF (DUF218 family)
MVFILSKVLLFLIKPILWVCALFISAIFCRNRGIRKRLIIAGFVMLFIFSNSFIIGKILNVYEEGYPELKHYDYGIVLGGFSGVNENTNEIVFNWSADRLFETISLYGKGNIDHILVSSGNSNLIKKDLKEADLVYKYLRQRGLPDSVILIENQSRNTIENAKNSIKMIDRINPKAKILVITSAWHIPRARISFNKYFKGDITYYPTNYMGKTKYNWSDFIVPSVTALSKWEFLIKEWIGLIADRLRS